MPINRPVAKTEAFRESPEPRVQEYPVTISGENVAGGMNTFLDSANLDTSQFTSLQNVIIRTGKLSRRLGSSLLTPIKPNSNLVQLFYSTQAYSQNVYQLRFDQTTVYSRGAISWTQVTPHAGAPTPFGGAYDRWRVVTIDDRIFASNNGVQPIYEIDPVNNWLLALGNAPSFKYLATIANRVVGAYLTKPYGGGAANPNLVGWCGDTNFGEWNFTVDVSAGTNPLLDTLSPGSDFITGLVGLETALLVMRTKSIVLGTLLQSATQPFYFYIAVPGIGCNAPDALVSTTGGIIWYDHNTRMVYRYILGAQAPELIGLPVAESIANQVTDPAQLTASWDDLRLEYSLCIINGSTTTIWTYSQKTNTWWFNTYPNVTGITSVIYATGAIHISDLVGTIDSQAGTIGQYSSGISLPSRFYTLSTGDIIQEDPTQSSDNGTVFSTIVSSKDFENIEIDAYWKRVRLEFNVQMDANFGLYYSKDNGETWFIYKSVTLKAGNSRQILVCNKNIKSRQLMWRLVSNSGQWDLVRYQVFGTQGAPSRGLSTQG